jgi:hypothetical protein
MTSKLLMKLGKELYILILGSKMKINEFTTCEAAVVPACPLVTVKTFPTILVINICSLSILIILPATGIGEGVAVKDTAKEVCESFMAGAVALSI